MNSKQKNTVFFQKSISVLFRLKVIIFIFILMAGLQLISAQSPKREMRATWLATVFRIDWPGSTISVTGNATQVNSQKQDMIRILDSLASANMNAVFFQVRSRCDAMYKSSYEPWSTDLVQYRGFDPGYDPLAFAIEEAHKRGIELHAWLNPYRFETALNQWSGKPGDYRTTNPEWLLTYSSGITILDPGRPQVVKRIKDIVGEIVTNYNVDGIMFDDYFYAYGGTSATLDASTQALYKPANMDLGDWRRANVNKMIAEVYDTIQDVKPFVRFGVSPFGIWTTNQNVASKEGIDLPVGITGSDMYASIYCDPVAWLKEKSVDYISPQLYWPTGGSQDYSKLCPWWSNLANRFGRHFYSSQDIAGLLASNYAPRKTAESGTVDTTVTGIITHEDATSSLEKFLMSKPAKVSASGFSQEQIGLQIGLNRSSDKNNAPGSIFFSTKQLYQTKGFINYLKKMQFTHKAFTPTVEWKAKPELSMVSEISLTGNVLSWTSAGVNRKYGIYIIPNSKFSGDTNFSSSEFLAGISFNNTFTVPASVNISTHKFAVSVLDFYGNESAVRIMGQDILQIPAASLIFPAANQSIILPFTFSWSSVPQADSYFLEIAEDLNFAKLIASREFTSTTASTTLFTNLIDGKVYFWRVRTRAINANDVLSEVRKFMPVEFKITNPVEGSKNISLTPAIEWQDINPNNNYLVEIATSNQFTTASVIFSGNFTNYQIVIPSGKLIGSTTYYVRVTTNINNIITTAKTISFTTKEHIPQIPQILSPVNNASVFGNQIKITWNEDAALSYRIEMSKDALFPVRNTTVKTAGLFATETTFDGLTAADYYFRVRADYAAGQYTNWSATHKVSLKDNTTIDIVPENQIQVLTVNGKINIKISDFNFPENNTYLCNLNGTRIPDNMIKKEITSDGYQININNLANGVYILKIINNQVDYSVKIIK